jgi:Nif-specific regulatory protein
MPNYQTLFEISRLLAAETNIARLLPLAMDKVIEAAGAQRGMILVCGEDGELLFETARNSDKMDIAQPEFEISKTIIDPVLKNGEPVLLENAVDSVSFGGSESIKKLKILSVVCVALKHEDSIIGAIYIDNRKVTALFNEDTLDLLTEFANLIAVVVKNALQHRQLVQRQQRLTVELAEEKGYGQIVGKSEAMARVLSLVDDIADSDATVLISGETGTGKELIARALHAKSSRKNHEFVALIESELFGHEKGAFTGAHQRKAGWFEAANNGTLFLDEIAELPAPVQVKLLRFLQSGEYTPVGSTKTKTADVRLISATNRDLKKLIKEKAFREDLYYRLNTIELGLPPLRARHEDVIENIFSCDMLNNSRSLACA